jgi:endoglucanase
MHRRNFFYAGVLAGCGLLPLWPFGSLHGEERRRPKRGVSLAGPEFGAERAQFSNQTPGAFGRDYTYNSEATVAYFCSQGLRLFRLPLRWERLQPRLGQPLDADELDRVRTVIAWARKHEGEVIVDIHNYGRYVLVRDGKPTACVIDQAAGGQSPVRREHLADLWRRLSQVFADEPAVYAYGLMNEPHDMGSSNWKSISQATVDAIRGLGDRKRILVAGDGWSSAVRFAALNGPRAWINDPARNVVYEAHCYFDEDGSGHYAKSYDAELARDPRLEARGADRVRPFLRWCRSNAATGFLGEFGIPGADPRWQAVLARFLDELDRADMGGCYWAAGEWWGDYPLSIQPRDPAQKAAPQLRVLIR